MFKIINKLPWGYLLLLPIWLIILVFIAYRYFNIDNQNNKYSQFATEASSITDNSYKIMQQLNKVGAIPRKAVTLDNLNGREFINLGDEMLYLDTGELYAVYNNDSDSYTLFLNQMPISQISNPNIIYSFRLINNHTILVLDANIVDGKYVYSMLEFGINNQRTIHEFGNSEKILDARLGQIGSCILFKFQGRYKYSESENYEIYQYCIGNDMLKIAKLRSNSGYQRESSSYSFHS